MSIGPGCENENPRESSSSWAELRPRSNRTPVTGPSPSLLIISGRPENRILRTLIPCGRSRDARREHFRVAINPDNSEIYCLDFLFITAEWPPKPKVASINMPSGAAEKISTTSPAMTGMWSMLNQKLPGHIFIRIRLTLLVFPENLRIPYFDFVKHSADDNVLLDAGQIEQILGDADPPQFVDPGIGGVGKQGPARNSGRGDRK